MARQHLLATTTIGLIAVGLSFIPGSSPEPPVAPELEVGRVPATAPLVLRLESTEGSVLPEGSLTVTSADGHEATHRVPSSGEVQIEGLRFPAELRIDLPGHQRLSIRVERAGELSLDLHPGALLHGQIVSASGEALAGVRVRVRTLETSNTETSWETTTDEQGAFRLDTLPPGPVWIQAVLAGRAPLETRAEASLQGGDVLTLSLEAASRIVGRVLHADGSPADGPEVHFAGSGVWPARYLRGGDDGRFAIEDLPPGVYAFRAQLDGDVSAAVEGVVLEEGEVRSIELTLQRGARIHGRVVDQGTGETLSGAEIVATAGALSLMPLATRSEEDGTFSMGPLPPREYRVRVSAPDHVPTEVSLRPTADAITLPLERAATLIGRVVNDRGAPVRGAVLRVMADGESEANVAGTRGAGRFQAELFEHHRRGATPLGLGSLGVTLGAVPPIPVEGLPLDSAGSMRHGGAQSGAGGRFVLRGIPSGRYQIRALHPDYASAISEVRMVTAGATLEGWVITLSEGITLEGRVVDNRGYPVPGVQIEVSADHEPVPRTTTSGADGIFIVPGLSGFVTLSARATDMPLVQEELNLSDGAPEAFTIELPGRLFALQGRVRDSRSFPVEGTTVTVRSLNRRYPTRRWARTASDGSFNIPTLPPPPYRVEADHPDYALTVVDRLSSADDELDLQLVPGGQMRARLFDAWTDEPVSGVLVQVRGPQVREARTGSDGWARLSRLPLGTYQLHATSAEYPPLQTEFSLEADVRGDAEVVIERLELAVAGSVRGLVRDRHGEPAPRARVSWGASPDWNRSVTTDASGRFLIQGIPPGEVLLHARHPAAGEASSRRPTRIRAREETPGAEITLPLSVTDPSEDTTSREREGVAIALENVDEGVRISAVVPRSGADRADLRVDDIILSVDEEPVFSAAHGEGLLRGRTGREFIITTRRDEQTRTTPVQAERFVPPED